MFALHRTLALIQLIVNVPKALPHIPNLTEKLKSEIKNYQLCNKKRCKRRFTHVGLRYIFKFFIFVLKIHKFNCALLNLGSKKITVYIF